MTHVFPYYRLVSVISRYESIQLVIINLSFFNPTSAPCVYFNHPLIPSLLSPPYLARSCQCHLPSVCLSVCLSLFLSLSLPLCLNLSPSLSLPLPLSLSISLSYTLAASAPEFAAIRWAVLVLSLIATGGKHNSPSPVFRCSHALAQLHPNLISCGPSPDPWSIPSGVKRLQNRGGRRRRDWWAPRDGLEPTRLIIHVAGVRAPWWRGGWGLGVAVASSARGQALDSVLGGNRLVHCWVHLTHSLLSCGCLSKVEPHWKVSERRERALVSYQS